MFHSLLEAQSYIKEQEIELIDFKIVDQSGRWHHLTIPASRFNEKTLKEGIGFDGSSYGFLSVEKSDMVFVPDLSSAYRPPFEGSKSLAMIGNIHLADKERNRYPDDPRYIVEKVKKLMVELDIADTALLGPEFEFYLLDSIQTHCSDTHQEVSITPDAGRGGAGHELRRHNNYHLDRPLDSSADLRDKAVLCLEKCGIPIKYHHAENGRPGQVEIEVVHGDITAMADRAMKIKSILRLFAEEAGKTVTFMPKPFAEEAGSGFHVHLHLFKDGKPLFYDPSGYAQLSETALHAIGGILRHAPALMAFTNPSTNSFKRLVPGFEAPVNLCFGLSNRSGVIRIPGYANTPDQKRFEVRFPDLTCNPYLAFSALLMAAIDGIENQVDPTAEGYGPFDVNLYELPPEQLAKVKGLPKDILEAVDALEKDYEFLTRSNVFSENLIRNQIKKLREDHLRISKIPHPEEFMLYYNL